MQPASSRRGAAARAPDPSRPSLGAFLRARRERLRPEDFDLPRGNRRRVAGLRREEVAQLCGISPTWYTWIEQARTTAISVEALSAIATGLRLARAERAYLFELAARADPHPPPADARDPHGLAALVRSIGTPAYVLDRHWVALAWNRAAAKLFQDWLGSPAKPRTPRPAPTPQRNLLRYVFEHPLAARFIVGWEERARRLVAEYRADTAAWPDDPQRQTLVRELCASSPLFEATWRSQQVLARDGGRRRFQARRGPRDYDQYVMRLAARPDLKLTILVPC